MNVSDVRIQRLTQDTHGEIEVYTLPTVPDVICIVSEEGYVAIERRNVQELMRMVEREMERKSVPVVQKLNFSEQSIPL